nr:uncharacterized protein LOC116427726 [Nomia melanderi]
MFYSVELLSLRRKGKLARCWLAATNSEKMFKKSVKSSTIEKMDVAVICEEILSKIQVQSNRIYNRFSLYLSSQLMYGATKILYYQTKQLQDYLFTANWKIFLINSRKAPFMVEMMLEVPNLPPVTEVFYDPNRAMDKHLITEDPYTSVIEHQMQEELNFGALTDYEMEKFLLLLQTDEQSLNEVRRFCRDSSLVPPIDLNNLEETNEIEKEMQAPSTSREEVLVEIEDAEFKSPVIPRKRKTKSFTETPSKRRKISLVEEPLLPVDVPLQVPQEAPSLVAEEPSMPALPEASAIAPQESSVQKSMLVLEREISDQIAPITEDITVVLPSRPKQRKIFDVETKLSDAIMQKYIRDVAAHTMKHTKYAATLPSPMEYLKQPSTKTSHGVLAQKLTKFYSGHMTTRRIEENEYPHLEIDSSFTSIHRPVRVNGSIIQEKTNEMSSAIAIPPAEMSEQSKMVENANQIEDIQIEALRPPIEESSEAVPEMNGFKERIGEITTSSQKPLNGKIRKSASKASSVFSLTANITKSELKALLEIHWRQGTIIKFHDIISPDTYTKVDAACAFQYCLGKYNT